MSVPSDSIVSPSLHVQWGYTPHLRAAQKGCAGIARFLLARGSSVQEQNIVGWPKGMLSSCDHLMLFATASALLEVVVQIQCKVNLTLYHNVWAFPLMWRGLYNTKTPH